MTPDTDDLDDQPLEYKWKPKTLVEIPPEMVASMAMGMEEPDIIASRHGFSGARWEKLKAWKPFLDAVQAQKAEFERTGVTFKLKSSMKADMLADQVFVEAMNPETPLTQKLATLQYFTRVGELEPKENRNAAVTDGFQISINIGGDTTTVTSRPYNFQTGEASKNVDVTDVDEKPLVPQIPDGYYVAPLVDPELLSEMARNIEES